MVQSPLTITLRPVTWIGGFTVCLLLIGCATLTDFPRYSVADRSGASGPFPSRPRFDDPFRRQASRNRNGYYRDLPGSFVPFSWTTVATTTAGEPLQIASTGAGGFRTMVVGSVGGHDPIAVKLTEDLAHYLHNHRFIMGGADTTVLRTLNPDGLKLRRHRNASGVYLNNLFPRHPGELSVADLRRRPREVRFLMEYISEHRPQRMIHIRTVRDSSGMLAVSHGAMDSGVEVAEWLGFGLRSLPKGVSRGTLESWAALRGDCDVITVGIPRQTAAGDTWQLYGDAILSLLLDGDSESRHMARELKKRRTASRRREWDHNSFDYMFRED